MQENSKTLQQITKEKALSLPQIQPQMNQTPKIQNQLEDMPSNTLPENHIVNVIKTLKAKQDDRAYIWFDFDLPSNGKCGYDKNIKMREMTTADERVLIKEMFSSKENSLLNVIQKCVKFEGQPNFDFENLTTFDQDFILIELSAITFPGEKDITITDDANHKISLKLNKSELSLSLVPFDLEYPVKVNLPMANLSWYLNFTTLKTLKEIDKATKSLSGDVLMRLFISIALTTNKIEKNGQAIKYDNFYEVIRLLESLTPTDLKIIIDFYNEKSNAYGYKLNKDYYCTECGKGGQMELEPLNFFRVTI